MQTCDGKNQKSGQILYARRDQMQLTVHDEGTGIGNARVLCERHHHYKRRLANMRTTIAALID